MQEYVVKVKSLTDIMPGSGESIPGIIDSDIRYDALGLPYMNAKTVKGHLREAMEQILAVTGGRFAGITADSLLGGSDLAGGSRIAKIRVSDMKLSKAVRDVIQDAEMSGSVTKEEILDSLTQVYASTKISGKTGTAEAHTLRKYRLLKKGLLFEVVMEAEDLSRKEEELLFMSVRAIQHIGTLKSKGKGSVLCTIYKKGGIQA